MKRKLKSKWMECARCDFYRTEKGVEGICHAVGILTEGHKTKEGAIKTLRNLIKTHRKKYGDKYRKIRERRFGNKLIKDL